MPDQKHDGPIVTTALRLVVRVLQDIVATQTFTSYVDLREGLKERCAKLKIPYDSQLVGDAIEQLERGGERSLIRTSIIVPEPVPEPPPGLSREDAAVALHTLLERHRARSGTSVRIKTIEPVHALTGEDIIRQRWDDDRRKAMDLVQQEMLATAARCDALEEALVKPEPEA